MALNDRPFLGSTLARVDRAVPSSSVGLDGTVCVIEPKAAVQASPEGREDSTKRSTLFRVVVRPSGIQNETFSCPAGHSPAGEKKLQPTAVDPCDKKRPSAKRRCAKR